MSCPYASMQRKRSYIPEVNFLELIIISAYYPSQKGKDARIIDWWVFSFAITFPGVLATVYRICSSSKKGLHACIT
jgi:hypothetical protein